MRLYQRLESTIGINHSQQQSGCLIMFETRLLLRPMESSFDTQAMTYPTRSVSVGVMCFIHLGLSLFITTIAVNRRLYIGMPILPSNAPLQQVTVPKSHTVYIASQKYLIKTQLSIASHKYYVNSRAYSPKCA